MSAVLKDSTATPHISERHSAERQRVPARLRLFYGGRRLSGRIQRLIRAIYAGFWLGWFDDADVRTVVGRLYEENDLYRTAEHNLQGLFSWETELLNEHFASRDSIVVAAAGGGREMIGLARAGWRVDGFECDPVLVEKCERFLSQAAVAGHIVQAPPDKVPSGFKQYGAAIVGCGALGHIVGRAKRVNFLKDLKSLMTSGAPLLLSVGRRPQGSRYHQVIYQIAKVIRMIRGSQDSPEVGDDPLDCYTHLFTEAEVHAELRDAGFEVVKSIEKLEIYVVAKA
jgi:hypothetical protein